MKLLIQMLAVATPSDVNSPVTRDHRTALHIAAYHGDIAMTQLLLWVSCGSSLEIIICPCQLHQSDSCHLLQHKADLRLRTSNGESAAAIAKLRNNQGCYRVIMSAVPLDQQTVTHDRPNHSPTSLTSSASSLSASTLPSESAVVPAPTYSGTGYYNNNDMHIKPNINYMYTSAI